jgi:acyl carrier protein
MNESNAEDTLQWATTPERKVFYEKVLRFVVELWVEQSCHPRTPPKATPDDNLFDLGLVDSLSMVEVLVFVENMTSRAIDLLNVDPEGLFTLKGMYDATFNSGR